MSFSSRQFLAVSACTAITCALSLRLVLPACAEDQAAPSTAPQASRSEADNQPAASASTTGGGASGEAAVKEKETAGGTTSEQAAPGSAGEHREINSGKANPAGNEKAGEEHKPVSAAGTKPNAAAAGHPLNEKPLRLYGRIEELCSGTGAKIPLKMKAMVPIRDTSLDEKTKLAGNLAMQTYPMDYRGTWSGELTVNSANFDRTYFQFAPDEARKEEQLLRPGTRGQYSVTFYEGNNHHIEMQPSQVVFQGTESMSSQMKLMAKSSPGLGSLLAAQNNPMMANMQMPVMFALHMGTPIVSGEIGVTGNQLTSDLMKNTLRELSKGVLENQIVTRDRDRDPTTGKVQNGLSESVLRFTRLNRDQLYLQAAYVYYRSNGQFQAKYVLYGTLNRSNGAAASYPNPYGAGSNPFGALMPGMGNGANPFGGAGGAAGLQQQMQQMQKMIQQMGGK